MVINYNWVFILPTTIMCKANDPVTDRLLINYSAVNCIIPRYYALRITYKFQPNLTHAGERKMPTINGKSGKVSILA